MKLWQAILIGCDKRAQAFGRFFEHNNDGSVCSCAVGAAIEATWGYPYSDSILIDWNKTYPVIHNLAECPDKSRSCSSGGYSVGAVITHLNDIHKWTRERIALEFVKPIEEEEECLL